jgi:hypothetical protein
MRMPKVGDKVICLEDESLGEVVSLTAGGSPDITFDDGSRGTYMLREFAELFGYVNAAQQKPVACRFCHSKKGCWTRQCYHCGEIDDVQQPAPLPEQEPVAWMVTYGGLTHVEYTLPSKVVDTHYQPLYTTTPAAQWDKPSASFNDWWDSYHIDPANPFEKDSAAYWAWAGWRAAQRPWVGLTDEEKKNLATAAGCTEDDDGHIVTEIFRLAEAKLKEKNT